MDGPTPDQLSAAGFDITDIEGITLARVLNRNSFQGREIVTDPRTGATQQPVGADNIEVFSLTPFVAPQSGEGECCVNDGEAAQTIVCFRNDTNPCTFA